MSEATNDPGPKPTDPGASWVKIRWIEPIGDMKPGEIEWCEQRRANGLVAAGDAVIVED
jgi:hypothetical protein